MDETRQHVAYLIFDVEAVADGGLVKNVKYPEEHLTHEEAIKKYREELLEKYGNDVIPPTFMLPTSVAVVKGLIYGTGSKNGKNIVWARKESDGSPVWNTPIADEGHEPNGTPVVVRGKVYALTTAGTLACLDAKSGKIIWKTSFTRDLGGQMMSGWGYSETPLIDGDNLICTPGGDRCALAALKADTGEVIWKMQTEAHPLARITGTPVLHEGRVYVPVTSLEEPESGQADYSCCSFRGVLEGRDDMQEAPVVVFDEYGPVRMVRTSDWKYVHRHPDGPHELFHLAADPGERTNRIDDPSAAPMREALARRLDDWFSIYVDPVRDGVDKGVTGCGQLGRLEPRANTGMFADSHSSNTDWDLWVPASDEQTPSYAGKGETKP